MLAGMASAGHGPRAPARLGLLPLAVLAEVVAESAEQDAGLEAVRRELLAEGYLPERVEHYVREVRPAVPAVLAHQRPSYSCFRFRRASQKRHRSHIGVKRPFLCTM